MITPRLFLCSGAKLAGDDPIAAGRQIVELDSIGSGANVNIRFEKVARIFQQHLSPRLVDLLEIASYVYSADCATNRGTAWTDGGATESWGRDFLFVIPVREPKFWNSAEIGPLITDVLNFLSNDKYSFTFVPLEHDRSEPQYLEFGGLRDWPFYAPERVVMFSGGLDSLAGAVETARAGSKLVLVSHRPVTTAAARQRKLFKEIQKEFPDQVIHIPVWINKDERFGRESTQRTRSFLYSALGTVVGQSVRAGGVRFFENGVVSLNLPVADEVLRARASRTTHPVALQLFQFLYSKVTERDFAIDNPYIHKTKTEVVASLSANKAAHLISLTCSCSHSMFKSKAQQHCGTCSQCIDRRFAITAAGLLAYDPEIDYISDVFAGPRKDGYEKSVAVDYVRHGIELSRRSESELAALFNAELSRAVRFEPKKSEAAEKIIVMHKRHGGVVTRMLREKIAEYAVKFIEGTIDDSSLLALVIGKKHLQTQGQADSAQANISVQPMLGFPGPPQNLTLVDLEQIFQRLLAKFGPYKQQRTPKKKKLTKRDTVICAAILMDLKGMRYCTFVQNHGLRPKWSDSGGSYSRGYEAGEPWRKKIQDEKTRAKLRMDRYADSELADAIIAYLPQEFDSISPLIHSRNSHRASKNNRFASTHKS